MADDQTTDRGRRRSRGSTRARSGATDSDHELPAIYGAVYQFTDRLEPLPGIRVLLTNGGKRPVEWRITDANGQYLFENLEFGTPFNLSFQDDHLDPETLAMLTRENEPPADIEISDNEPDVLMPDIVYMPSAAGDLAGALVNVLQQIKPDPVDFSPLVNAIGALKPTPPDFTTIVRALDGFKGAIGQPLRQMQQVLQQRLPVPPAPPVSVADVEQAIADHIAGWTLVRDLFIDPLDVNRDIIANTPALEHVESQLDELQALVEQEIRWLTVQRQLLSDDNAPTVLADVDDHLETHRRSILQGLDALADAAATRGLRLVPETAVTWLDIANYLNGLNAAVDGIPFDGGAGAALAAGAGAIPARP